MDIDRLEELIESIQINRSGMKEMLDSAVRLRKELGDIAPKTNDFKYKFRTEEKMKTISSVLNSELSIRKQIDDSVKDEITIMGKYLDKDGKDDRKILEQLAKLIETKDGSVNSSIVIEDDE